MVAITIEISDDTKANLAKLAERCTEIDQERGGATTHGALDISRLLQLLVEDAALVIARPGSWEGTGMAHHLAAHGYEL